MITDINHKTIISELNKAELPSYWMKYFEYEADDELFNFSNNEIIKEIESEKKKDKPYIDSQILLNRVLNKFGKSHNFHRQFRERHGDSDSGQVLGMQLYHLMIKDSDVWVYCEIKRRGHLFPHSTYFK